MNTPDLYNLTPLLPLLLGAAALSAMAALAWWWRHGASNAAQRRRALTLLTVFLTFDLVLLGSFTRLTDSGLGCPDWPGCYGSASPWGAHGQIAQAQDALPTGPVTHFKAWVEMVHRYLAMALGGLLVWQAAAAWRHTWRAWRGATPSDDAVGPWWASAALVWVCLQGAFGALTVTMKLFPLIVSLHLLGAYVLLGLLVLQWHVQGGARAAHAASEAMPSRWRWLVALALVVVLVQSMLGAWVSTNYAVLACSEVPKCQGQWWPAMDLASGFEMWRPLGGTADGGILSFQALTAIHWVHRLFAVLTFAVLSVLLYFLRGQHFGHPARRWLAVVLVAQLLTGVSNVVLDWPLLAALLHTSGAGALIGLLTWLLAQLTLPQMAARSSPEVA